MSLVSTSNAQETFTGLGPVARMPRVNLLPPEVLQARKLRRRKAVLAGTLVVVVAGIGGGYVLASHARADAQTQLDEAKAESVRLTAEQAKYADVPKTMAAIDAAESARATAMATDVEWYRTMTNFALTLPPNVWFDTVELKTIPNDGTAPVEPTSPSGIGVVTVDGKAMDHPNVASWLDVLGDQPGLSNAYFTRSEKKEVDDKTIVEFSSSAVVTDEALSHRYDRKQG